MMGSSRSLLRLRQVGAHPDNRALQTRDHAGARHDPATCVLGDSMHFAANPILTRARSLSRTFPAHFRQDMPPFFHRAWSARDQGNTPHRRGSGSRCGDPMSESPAGCTYREQRIRASFRLERMSAKKSSEGGEKERREDMKRGIEEGKGM